MVSPALRRGPYSGTPMGRTRNGQSWHGGDRDGHHHNRPYYYNGNLVYSWPSYSAGLGNWWLWPPYFGNWDSSGYDPEPEANVTQDQSYAPAPEPESEERSAYQPYQPYQAYPYQAYPYQAYVPYQAVVPYAVTEEPTLTIVYKDGHSQQIRNYAMTRTSLLLLDEASTGRAPEISLDAINIAATEQVNRAAGVNFEVPARN